MPSPLTPPFPSAPRPVRAVSCPTPGFQVGLPLPSLSLHQASNSLSCPCLFAMFSRSDRPGWAWGVTALILSLHMGECPSFLPSPPSGKPPSFPRAAWFCVQVYGHPFPCCSRLPVSVPVPSQRPYPYHWPPPHPLHLHCYWRSCACVSSLTLALAPQHPLSRAGPSC